MTDKIFPTDFPQIAAVGSMKLLADNGVNGWAYASDIVNLINVTYATLFSPAFTGVPTVPTPAPGSVFSKQAVNCEYVAGEIRNTTAGVATWNGRSGSVTMTLADITSLTGTGGTARTTFGLALVAASGSYADLTGRPGNFTVNTAGFVPPPVSSSGAFLRDDGSWAQVGGGGGQSISVRVITSSANTTLLSNDTSVYFNRTASPAVTTVTLPASPAVGAKVKIKDMSGNAGTFSITVQPTSGTIDGAANFVFDANYDGFEFEFNGIEWSVF